MAVLNGYRGNKNPEDDIKDITSTYDKSIMPGNGDDDKEGNGNGDDGVVVKKKEKVNKKGELITVTKTKDPRTGKKTFHKHTQGPTTIDATGQITGGGEGNLDIEYETKPFKPTVETTPGTEGESKPYVKPIKKPSFKEAYEKTDKSIPFEEWKQKAIKWNKDNPPSPPKPDLIKIEPRPAVQLVQKVKSDITPLNTIDINTYSKDESWTKRKGKKKKKFDTPPPKKERNPGGEYSTQSSTACTKEGSCGPGQLYSSGMFSAPTNKERRQINKGLRESNRASRKDYRDAMSDVRWHNRQVAKNRSKGDHGYKQHGPGFKKRMANLKARLKGAS